MNQETISGIVSDLKVIPTRTGRSMVMFVLGGKCCKAFGDIAVTLQTLSGVQVEIASEMRNISRRTRIYRRER